jgi:hypothetical protein
MPELLEEVMRRRILKVTIGGLQGVLIPFGGFLDLTFLMSKSSKFNIMPDLPHWGEGGLT